MKILIVYPTHLDVYSRPIKYKKAYMPPLVFAVLNGLTPPRHTVHFINDVVEEIDYSVLYDLVAITAMTAQAERAYMIADAYRRDGVPVVIGGMHASALPEEAKLHADAVVIGEADNVWWRLLDDLENDDLKEIYRDKDFPDLQNPVIPRWESINMKIYPRRPGWKYPVISLFATRGCPYGCAFCSVSKFFGKKYREKPIGSIDGEIEATKNQFYFFVDDNIAFDADYSRELFAMLRKKNIEWYGQASTTVLKNPDLIDMAGKSGCQEMFIGVESINTDSLDSARKKFNRVEEYEELIKLYFKAGITPTLSFIFGFDEDTVDRYRMTLEFLKRNRIYYAIFWLLTPFPGTELYNNMVREGRMLHQIWSRYDGSHVVYMPKQFTYDQLEGHYWRTFSDYYSAGNIIPHAIDAFRANRQSLYSLIQNLYYQPYFMSRVKLHDHPYSGGFGWRIKPPR